MNEQTSGTELRGRVEAAYQEQKAGLLAAARRMAALQGISVLALTAPVTGLARALVAGHAVPATAAVDAVHIAVATPRGVVHAHQCFPGDRGMIREYAANFALDLLRRQVVGG